MMAFKSMILIIFMLISQNLIHAEYSSNGQSDKDRKKDIDNCIKCIEGQIDTGLGRAQCVYDLVELKPDPNIVVPILIKHLEVDHDETVKEAIARTIILYGHTKDIIKSLQMASRKPMTVAYKNKQYSVQGYALKSLSKIGDLDSIQIMVDLFFSDNVNMFAEMGTANEDFKIESLKVLNKLLETKRMSNMQRVELTGAKIWALGSNPADNNNEKYLVDGLNDHDESTRSETYEIIKRIKNSGKKTILDQTGKKKLLNDLYKHSTKLYKEINK
jgi:HEAT repeat protein